MERRSAARELAFLAIFQLPKNPENLNKTDIQAICLSAIRTLADYSKNNIKQSESFFIQVERALMEHEINHETNEDSDVLTKSIKAVPLPNTAEFIDHLNNCYHAITMMRDALQIPELYWHLHDDATEKFAINLVMNYIRNREEIENTISEVSESWDISRMRKTDKTIIDLAVTEMVYDNTPRPVIVAEAIKLANKYSAPESVKFINGVLADVIKLIAESA